MSIRNHAGSMSFQGAFLQIQNVDEKISNTIHYNWKLNDELLTFCIKARLKILPANFTLYIWNRDNDLTCQLCNYCTAHFLNGCHAVLGNVYSMRHNRIVNYLFDQLKFIDRRYRNWNYKNIKTIMQLLSITIMQRRKIRHCSLRPSNEKYWDSGNCNL